MRISPSTNGSKVQFFPEASRKRKTTDTNLANYAYDGNSSSLENLRGSVGHAVEDYTSQHNLSQVNRQNVHFNQSEYPKTNNSESRNYAAGNFLLGSEAKGDYIDKSPFGSSQQFYHSKSAQFELPVSNTPGPHESQHLVYDPACQPEHGKVSSYFSQDRDPKGMSESSIGLSSATNLGHESSNLSCLYQWLPSQPPSFTNSPQPMEVKENVQDLLFSKGVDTSIGRSDSMQASSVTCERRESSDYPPYHTTEIKSRDSICTDVSSAHLLNDSDSNRSGNTFSQLPESSIAIEACTVNRISNSSTHASSASDIKYTTNSGSSTTETLLVDKISCKGHGLLALPSGRLTSNVEEQLIVTGKGSLVMAEKLWDGTLQLNTSTTLSAVAYFKSGEKAQDVYWSERVEIKGKVRLQAFEKFIQELPRSRSRALMVISLCWNPESSKEGLEGIRRVSKGYRNGDKVGFAKICPAVDLYVCPRSDAIITILAKYGFFKGMTAVEEDKDSLIGCIVWRRGSTSSNPSSTKNPEKKEVPSEDHPLNSPGPSVLEMNSAAMVSQEPESEQVKILSALVSEIKSVPPENVEHKTAESLSIKSSTDSGGALSKAAVPYNSHLTEVRTSSELNLKPTCVQKDVKYSETPIMLPAERKQDDTDPKFKQKFVPERPQIPLGVPDPTLTTGLYSLNNYKSWRPIDPGDQTPMQYLNSSYIQKPVHSDPKPELTEHVLPGLPPSHISHDNKVFTDGVLNSHRPFAEFGELKNPVMSVTSKQRCEWNDDEGDLPEFDFDAAYGISKSPSSKLASSAHQARLPVDSFNSKILGDKAKHETCSMLLPTPKPTEVMHKQQVPSFQAKPCNALQEGRIQAPLAGNLKSQNHPRSQISRWDVDDMPEWCPPDLDNVSMPLPIRRPVSPSQAFYGPSPLNQRGISNQHGLLGPRPAFVNPLRPPPPLPNFSVRPFSGNGRRGN